MVGSAAKAKNTAVPKTPNFICNPPHAKGLSIILSQHRLQAPVRGSFPVAPDQPDRRKDDERSGNGCDDVTQRDRNLV